ncbi:hypothetical protein CSOJ01_06358 [Colletotrichum sojae]|uniref:Uncharacterized protein n=1 Tax=Colletotrichum sojae TaxID=2175907 RepID=A0A8H6JC90_9PEZI|nr:hypothetical protein CSOJ01_06358 [Colletotrichum sojae]
MRHRDEWYLDTTATVDDTSDSVTPLQPTRFDGSLSYFPSDGPQRDVASVDIVPHPSSLNLGVDEMRESTQLSLGLLNPSETTFADPTNSYLKASGVNTAFCTVDFLAAKETKLDVLDMLAAFMAFESRVDTLEVDFRVANTAIPT